jgi:hypothetical protein
MAPRRATRPGPSARYYQSNPEARKKKAEYDKKYHSTAERRKYRSELAKKRRAKGIMGKGGSDVSHTSNGGTKLENPSRNRARNGTAKGRPRAIRRGTRA